MQKIIEFPTRMRVEMRGRSISEMRTTLSNLRDSIVGTHSAALNAATVKLVDKGDYPEARITGKDGGVNWLKATSQDRIYGLIAIRILSFENGSHYRMDCNCDRCDKKYTHDVDLNRLEDGGDIVCWEFEHEEHREAFQNEVPFEGKLGDKAIKWRTSFGEDESLIERISQNNPKAKTDELSLNTRIVEIEGIDRNDVPKWIEGLGDERIEIEDIMSEATAGVDLVVDTQCPWCKRKEETSIPFDLEFWIPVVVSERNRRHKRKTRALAKAAKRNQ